MRQVKLVLITAAVVTVLVIMTVVLLLSPTEVSEDSEVSFKAADTLDVVQVFITNKTGTLEITFTGEGYEVDDIPADVVDVKKLIDLLSACGMVYATQTVATDPQNLGAYGLTQPTARVEVTYADESRLTLLIGDEERITKDTYFSVEGDPAVYLMDAERSDSFLLPKKAYVYPLVTPELVLSSPLSALLDVTFVGGQLTEPITVEATAKEDPNVARAALSFGTATHIVRGGGIYELDQTYAVEMLGALLGISAYDIVGYGLKPEEIMAFGFNEPTMQVAFDLKNGLDVEVEEYVLVVLVKDGVFYMTCNDRGVIYTVPEPVFLQLEYSKLLVRWFLSPLIVDVRAIKIETASEEYEFIISGETNTDIQVTFNGEELDIGRFRTLLGLLRSAAHDGRLLEDAVVEGEPLLRLTYYYQEVWKQPDVMELYPGDARRVYVRVNGVTELAMKDMYLTRVQEALSILWTDDPIETDW